MAVPGPSDPGASPVTLLRELQELIGAEAVATWCADLLAGNARHDDPHRPPLGWFGAGAAGLVHRDDLESSGQGYWVRVWAARGLLHGWDESAADVAGAAIVAGLGDDAWRVREMAAKVARRWQLHEAAEGLARLTDDDVPRVRVAAERARDALARPAAGRSTGRRSKQASAKPRKSGSPTRRPRASGTGDPVTVDDLDAALGGAAKALRRGLDRDWSVRAGAVSWSCRRTCAHIADDLVAYAVQLAGRVPSGYLPFRCVPSRGAAPGSLVELVEATGAVLAATVRVAPPDARGFHTYGMADREGFLAMGIGELMIHTHDIATGLGLAYQPPREVCARVLARVCPDVQPAGASPWSVLLWATGRRDLRGRPPVRGWRWLPGPDERPAGSGGPGDGG